MRCLRETARIVYSHFLPSRSGRDDRALARRIAARDMDAVLAHLPGGEPQPAAGDTRRRPIFLLSAGWRSGSTLLQRLVCADPDVLIWGEPYDLCHITETLMDSLRPFTATWPRPQSFIDSKNGSELAQQWIANLYPPLESLREAHERLFLTLFANTSEQRGYSRWGLKEVRYGREQIHYLRWLFPGARFVLLVRDPVACWRSYRGRGWFRRWPQQPIRTVGDFGRNWASLAGDFLDERESDDVYLLRYEDLDKPETVESLAEHLGVKACTQALQSRIGGGVRAATSECRLAATLENVIIRRQTRAIAGQFGYAT